MVESAKSDTTIIFASAPQNLEETTVKKVSRGPDTLTLIVKEGFGDLRAAASAWRGRQEGWRRAFHKGV